MRRIMPVYLVLAAAVLGLCFAALSMAQEPADSGETNAGQDSQAQTTGAATTDVPEAKLDWEWFRTKWVQGGMIMWFLAGLAVVALVFAIDRIFSLRRAKIVPHGLADKANKLWQAGQYEDVIKLGRTSRSTLGRIIVFLARHRNNSYEHLTAAAEDIAGRDFELQSRGNYPLNAVGTVAPLLGLCGTVFGLLGAFSTIKAVGSMDNPSDLAGDIGKALVTTAGGLVVAIPTLLAYYFFTNRTSMFAGILGEEVSGMIQDWFLTKADEPSAETAAQEASNAS